MAAMCKSVTLALLIAVYLLIQTSEACLNRGVRYVLRQQAKGEARRKKEWSDVPGTIERDGYPVETHVVTTGDGYILEVHRIPRGKDNGEEIDEAARENGYRPAIYLQHGFYSSSSNFILAGPGKSLAYALADAGYDVWMGNFRGNVYGRNHTTLDPDEDDSFWDFSVDETGIYDVPAIFGLVLNVTGQDKIHYLGHSMGTTSFFIAMNAQPELANKIKMANLMAPIAYVKHMRSPVIRLVVPFASHAEDFAEWIGFKEVHSNTFTNGMLSRLICNDRSVPELCTSFMFMITGFDRSQTNMTTLPEYLRHVPAGGSLRQIMHYAQLIRSGRFSHYDYGSRTKNKQAYNGSATPPDWKLNSIELPICTYWGKNDWVVEKEDYERLLKELPNVISNYTIPYDQWNHLDFAWGIDADKLLFPKILENVKKAEEKYLENEAGK